MLLLLLFALVVGAGTAVSPCVLPVLPAMLSASGAGGRRRPLGIVIGLSVTFAVTIVGLAKVVGGIGLGADPLRDMAIVVLGLSGVALLVPAVGAWLERPLMSLSRLGPRTRGDGFASGLVIGAALGFVYTPCAGPILAAVISVSAASGRAVAVGAAYALGTGLMLLALALGGRRLMDRLRGAGRRLALQRSIGVVLVGTAVVLGTMLDVRLDQWIAQNIPNVNVTSFLDDSSAVAARLSSLRDRRSRFRTGATGATLPGVKAPYLADLGRAPAFVGTGDWFNTPGGRPLSIAGLRGRVVLIDFWTYTCINCIRTLPYLEAWDAKYAAKGLVIVGVESPEFPFERDASNVRDAIHQFGIRYPVVQDNDLETWDAWDNAAWPADYLVDRTGEVRYSSAGEGGYATTESAIRELLAAGGARDLGGGARARDVVVPSGGITPEVYLGFDRALGTLGLIARLGTHVYAPPHRRLPRNHVAYGGTWTIGPQHALADAGASIVGRFVARRVYVVLSPPAHGRGHVVVFVDGRNVSTIDVTAQRLYPVASFASNSEHTVRLRFSAGTSAYSLTFG
jgi:cytochrome c biogenesis protein CcdA/thiol-disulfide isomerase/thioredoxin